MGIEVEVLNGNLDHALNQLKRKVQKDGILKELKLSSYAATRTQKRKIKDRIAIRRNRKNKRRRDSSEKID